MHADINLPCTAVDVPMVVTMKLTLFWDVMSCSLVMFTNICQKQWLNIYQTSWCHIPSISENLWICISLSATSPAFEVKDEDEGKRLI
jgi:hypothetical protein